MVTSFSDLLIELAQEPTPDPCVTTGNQTTCNANRGVTLNPGEVFITWWSRGFPGATFDHSGTLTDVGGREGRIQIDAKDICAVGDRSFWLRVVVPGAEDNLLDMEACYFSDDASKIETDLNRMIESVRWHS